MALYLASSADRAAALHGAMRLAMSEARSVVTSLERGRLREAILAMQWARYYMGRVAMLGSSVEASAHQAQRAARVSQMVRLVGALLDMTMLERGL